MITVIHMHAALGGEIVMVMLNVRVTLNVLKEVANHWMIR
jgi:hypothetical protein